MKRFKQIKKICKRCRAKYTIEYIKGLKSSYLIHQLCGECYMKSRGYKVKTFKKS